MLDREWGELNADQARRDSQDESELWIRLRRNDSERRNLEELMNP